MPRLLPDAWMPAGKLRRVLIHWTAGASSPSAEDLEAYHFCIDRVGRPHRGVHETTDNLSTADGTYAAHCGGFNTAAIGLAACGMAGAHERPFAPGKYPLTSVCWNGILIAAADLCRRYSLPPDVEHLLMHCEVQKVFGVPTYGKWDVSVRTWEPPARWAEMTPGEELRARVAQLLKEG